MTARVFAVAAADHILQQEGMPTYTELREELRKTQGNYHATGRQILTVAKAPATAVQAWEDAYAAGKQIIQRATP